MQINVINLDRSSDRLAEFTATNRHLTAVTRFPAIDGQRLEIEALARRGIVTADVLKTFSIGAVGLAISHVMLWEHVIATNEAATICEDDAIFHRSFEVRAEDILQSLPPGWDIILWGWNFDFFLSFDMLPGVSTCLAQFEQERMRAGIDAFQSQSITPRPFGLNWAFGTPCYSITPKGAQLLKDRCFPLRPQLIACPDGHRVTPFSRFYRTVGIDLVMNSIYRDIEAFVCFPPLVISKNESEKSTVQEIEQQTSS